MAGPSDGQYCYPLTVADGYSRFLLAWQGLRSTSLELARPLFFRPPPAAGFRVPITMTFMAK